MAKFGLEDGELLIERARIRDVSNGIDPRQNHGDLILTDRRLVLTEARDPTAGLTFLGWLGALLSIAFSEVRIKVQLRRDELELAEASGPKDLDVRSKGSGYGMVHFSVTIKDAASWAGRLARWAAGETIDEGLPSARLVDR